MSKNDIWLKAEATSKEETIGYLIEHFDAFIDNPLNAYIEEIRGYLGAIRLNENSICNSLKQSKVDAKVVGKSEENLQHLDAIFDLTKKFKEQNESSETRFGRLWLGLEAYRHSLLQSLNIPVEISANIPESGPDLFNTETAISIFRLIRDTVTLMLQLERRSRIAFSLHFADHQLMVSVEAISGNATAARLSPAVSTDDRKLFRQVLVLKARLAQLNCSVHSFENGLLRFAMPVMENHRRKNLAH